MMKQCGDTIRSKSGWGKSMTYCCGGERLKAKCTLTKIQNGATQFNALKIHATQLCKAPNDSSKHTTKILVCYQQWSNEVEPDPNVKHVLLHASNWHRHSNWKCKYSSDSSLHHATWKPIKTNCEPPRTCGSLKSTASPRSLRDDDACDPPEPAPPPMPRRFFDTPSTCARIQTS